MFAKITRPVKGQTTSPFSNQAKEYNNFALKSFTWNYIEKLALDKHIGKFYNKNLRILEAGCGNGRVIGHLISKGVPPKNITGIDVDKELISIAKKKYPEVKYIQGDLANINLESEQFGLIICTMVLDHMDNTTFAETILNYYRWLTKDGTLCCIVPHPVRMTHENLSTYFRRKSEKIETPWGTKITYHHRTVSNYIKELLKVGFKIISVDEPEVSREGMVDRRRFKKYSSFPVRLVVVGQKSES